LEQCAELLACDDTPEEIRADAKREGARISWEITETVNFASGRWALPPVFQNYQERIASSKARWKRLQPSGGEYVPALNNKIESDGFDRPEPVTPDLMARRAKLWAHSIVKQIVKEAPNARIPERSLFHECQSFKRGQPGKPSDDCGQQCRRQCLNAKRIDPGSLDRARRAFESHLSRQMDDGARLAAPATWWRVGLKRPIGHLGFCY
jgi:hypothetical protein